MAVYILIDTNICSAQENLEKCISDIRDYIKVARKYQQER